MAVKFSQDAIYKHFMERNARISVDDHYWIKEAIRNHQERNGLGGVVTATNTLLLIKPDKWLEIENQTYFKSVVPNPDMPRVMIDPDIIDRVITTKLEGSEYSVIHDLTGSKIYGVTFLCRPQGAVYDIFHFEGLDIAP
jgi:hypothetical protein